MSAKTNGSGNGNVQKKPPPATTPGINRYQPGDVVAMTPAALRTPRIAKMSPRLHYDLTGENKFLVLLAYIHPEEGPCVSLPCCNIPSIGDFEGNEGWIDPKTGLERCNGHPEVYFEKVDFKRLPKKGDKSFSVMLPFLPKFGLEYLEDDENPQFVGRALGGEASVTGIFAKFLKQLAEAGKLM